MKKLFPSEYAHNSASALNRALKKVPVYQSWRVHDPGEGADVDLRYAAMPVLTKADIRQYSYDGLVPGGRTSLEGLKKGVIELVRTSGTTDDQVTLIWNQAWWDASEKSSWQLNSYARRTATGRHREAILTSPVCLGVRSESGRQVSFQRRRLGRFLYMNEIANPAEWTTGYLDRMVDELEAFKPVFLEANPALLAKLARHINATGRKVYSPGLIVLTYEFPSRVHLRQIRAAFASPVASSYGSTETGYVFVQCEAGNFHQNVDFCRVDLQPFNRQYFRESGVGRLLVTTFGNEWFSVVRFNVGDVVRILGPGSCPCGRSIGYTAVMEGRAKDITLTMSGRAVTVNELDSVVSGLDWVLEYQMEQVSRVEYCLRVVSDEPEHAALERQATKALRGLYGKRAKVSVIFENIILPEISGKHRLAKTSFPFNVDDLFV